MLIKWYIFFVILTLLMETGIFYISLLLFPEMKWLDLMFIIAGIMFAFSIFLSSSGGMKDHARQMSMLSIWQYSSLPFKTEKKVYQLSISPMLFGTSLFLIACIVIAMM